MENIIQVIQDIEDETNNLHIPDKSEFKDVDDYISARKDYNAKIRSLEHDKFKEGVIKELGIVGNPKADMLFEISWRISNGSGFYDIFQTALELVELIK